MRVFSRFGIVSPVKEPFRNIMLSRVAYDVFEPAHFILGQIPENLVSQARYA